jgi:uncharacterized protein (DUF58 family)
VAAWVGLGAEELARAARLLVLRGSREATGLFAGNYASAFRGGGIEFEESRPWAPGDDVATFDWNATARTGEPHVKRFRAERNQTVFFALDVSGSMRFGSTGTSKLETAVTALALLASAAARAGDRIALLAFDAAVRASLAPGRGAAHALRVVRAAAGFLAEPGGGTRLAAGLRGLETAARRRGVVILLSDFLDPALLAPGSSAAEELARLARRHDLVAVSVGDPRELELAAAGGVRVADPEEPADRFFLPTSAPRARRRYREAAARRREAVAAALQRSGADLVWLDTTRSPLHELARFLHERAGRRLRRAP